MKRILLGAAAVAAAVTSVLAVPASAEDPVWSVGENAGLVNQAEKAVYAVANQALSYVPKPDDWQRRHVCVVVDQADRSWCMFFPWPI